MAQKIVDMIGSLHSQYKVSKQIISNEKNMIPLFCYYESFIANT